MARRPQPAPPGAWFAERTCKQAHKLTSIPAYRCASVQVDKLTSRCTDHKYTGVQARKQTGVQVREQTNVQARKHTLAEQSALRRRCFKLHFGVSQYIDFPFTVTIRPNRPPPSFCAPPAGRAYISKQARNHTKRKHTGAQVNERTGAQTCFSGIVRRYAVVIRGCFGERHNILTFHLW